MNCKNCGAPLGAGDNFCQSCGTPVNQTNTNNMNNNGNVPNNQNNSVNNGNNMVNGQNQNMWIPNNPNNNGYNNGMNQVPYQNNMAPKKNNFAVIIVILLIVAVVVLAVIFVPKFLDGKDNNNGNNDTNINDNDNNNGNQNAEGDNSAREITIDGVSLKVPSNMIYEISGNALLLGDLENTWQAALYLVDGSFVQLKLKMTTLKDYFESSGLVAKQAQLKEYGNKEFVTIELEESGTMILGAYTNLTTNKVAWVVIYNSSNSIDYNVLTKINPVLNSAVSVSGSKAFPGTEKFEFNMDEIESFAK